MQTLKTRRDSGTLYLTPRLRPPSERLELSPAGRFERFDERLVAERASGADARLDRRLFLGRDVPGLEPVTQHRPPVAMQARHALEIGQAVRLARHMRGGARPAPAFRALGELRPNRVEFDVTDRGEQMRVVHRIAGETPLPEIAGPAMRCVHGARIAPVRLGKGRAQPVRIGRHEDQVDVVRHQAPRQAPHVIRDARGRHEVAIGGIILVAEEHGLAPIAALRDVVGYVRDDDAGESGHGSGIAENSFGAI